MSARVAAAAIALAALSLNAQTGPGAAPKASIDPVRPDSAKLIRPYLAPQIPPARLGNSGRLAGLLHAGRLYLTVQDALALALENNIDIEVARYSPILADWRLLRSQAGGTLPGVPSNAAQAGQVASGQGVTGSQQAAGVSGGGGGGGPRGGTNATVTQIGPVTQNLDPSFQHASTFSHITTPQANARQSLTTALVADTRAHSSSLQQGLLSGGAMTLRFTENYLNENSPSNYLNPTVAPSLSLSFQHSLARGLGVGVNSRTITVSKMNVAMSDLTFKSRVITVVNQALNYYYSLAAANEDLKAKRLADEVARTLLDNVKRQVDLGAMAPTEEIRAEGQVATARQALIVAQTTVEQQEVRLKNLLSRNGLAEPPLRQARIELLDRITMPERDEFPPLEEMVKQALAGRVDLALDRSNLEASVVSAQGTSNGLLPNVQAFGALTQAGLAGTPQFTPSGPGGTGGYFEGGLGTAMGMVLRRNFPTQRIGVFAMTPLGNRQAQADQAIDQLQIRQTELSNLKRRNQVEVDLMNALVALRQARARYEAAVRNHTLQQELLDGEQNKYLLGASTPQNVIQLQRDLTTAQSSEVSALATYSNARLSLDQAMGRTLESSGVAISEARQGVVSRASSLPAAVK